MNKKILAFALAALGSWAMASDVVWSVDSTEITKAASYSYTYPDTGNHISVDTTAGVIALDFSVPTTGSVSAGYGFAWSQTCDDNWECTDDIVSLAAYKGVCLTYKADYPVRVEFKQSNISDYNFYGKNLAATTAYKSVFLAFDSLTQGWKSTTTVAWNAAKQKGVQFGYKSAMAKAAGSAANAMEITRFVLGDECPTFAPTLLGEDEMDTTLNEGDTLELDIATIFEDKDGDAVVTASIFSGKPNASIVDAADSYALDGIVKVVPTANTDGDAVLRLEAFDAKDTVTFTLNITVVNLENAPVAVDDSYSVDEDDTLTVKVTAGILANDYDVDNAKEDLALALVDSTAHGLLTLNTTGAFVYIPDENFSGEDSFTYTVTDSTGLVSAAGTVTITVKPVNDPLTLVIVDEEFFKDTIKLEEDFDDSMLDPIQIDGTILKFEDADGLSSLTIGAMSSNGIVNAKETEIKGVYYIELTPVENANGLDSIVFFAKDSEDSVGVVIYVNVTPVADNPMAVADTYTAYEDSLFTVAAKKGVLANDYHPDDSAITLYAVLDDSASHGVVELDSNGSFTYMPEADFFGKDSFTYHVVTADELLSETVTVTLNVEDMNELPAAVVVAVDTALDEDFTRTLSFTKAVVASWFEDPDGDALTFTAESDDGKLSATVSATGILQIKSVADSVGDAYVTVTADDGISGTASMQVHVTLNPVNDKPVVIKTDTIYVKELKDWEVEIDLDEYVNDPDGDALTYTPNLSTALKKLVTVDVDGATMTVAAKEDVEFESGESIVFGVKAADSTTYVTVNFYIVVGDSATISLKEIAAAPKATWQSAVAADRGSAHLLDMQGRVLWTAKLPVSESEVRAAADCVQGRKILRVNRQTWTVK